MSNMTDLKGAACATPLERVRYFPRQLLTADDLSAEQEYFREKMRRHNRNLLGWGVVCGCAVDPVREAKGWLLRVGPGYVVSPLGDEIHIPDAVEVDLQRGVQDQPCMVQAPCPPIGTMPEARSDRATAYIAVRYAECYSRPVRVHPAGCGCDETACEYSRVRETFEIKVLWALPESHRRAAQDDARWCEQLRKVEPENPREPLSFPVPSCAACADEPWVVLASVALPRAPGAEQSPTDSPDARSSMQVSYKDRRALLSVQRLQVASSCLRE